ncbi:PREDICTED: muscarinic acetylcholine receptor M4-like [Branchiostoma belcheri]|uniref:Muscarinic acetylcholine receptor M4-like n=1 Tax=Branchiostoma belcheri TaxID=7741 RepID=A0A6P4YCV5_BRABE|nr:PREDICTED: muscarinic acetylcholine receptor M4-like [Branchiostoma belcheri]
MTTVGEYILVVVNGITIVVTIVGGLLTILAICTRPDLRKLVNVPLVSLSCTDILFSAIYSPFWIQQILNPLWEPPPALCWLIGYISPVLWGASLWHMLCIALQRYFTICTNSTRLKSKQALTIMLLLTWSVPALSFLPLYIVEEVKVDPKLKRCGTANSDKLWAKVPPTILNIIFPYIAALASYILIQNHVRKSKNRVQAHARGPTNRLAVQYSKSGGGGVAVPSTSTETDKVTKPIRNLEGVVWVGDENSSSSEDEPVVKPGKPKVTIVHVAPASGTGKQQGKKSLPNNEERKGNEPDKNKGIVPTATIVSDQAGTNKGPRRAHVVPSNSSQNHNSAAERQITKMMMSLFAVFTLCNMPGIMMVMFSNKVPAEAFAVGQLLVSLNGALNPIIYGVMNKNIRRGYTHIRDCMLNFIT